MTITKLIFLTLLLSLLMANPVWVPPLGEEPTVQTQTAIPADPECCDAGLSCCVVK